MDHTRPAWVDKGRVPCLDALRVVAISAVIVEHFGLKKGNLLGTVFNGHFGVTLFFVISGFLITLLLLREHQAFGRVSLKAFYKRRFLRIFPAYYTYLLVIVALALAGIVSYSMKYWISAFTYMMCYMPSFNNAWLLGHSWSLAVEEHFYLLWPLLFTLFTPARAWKVLIVYMACIPFIRYGLWSMNPVWPDIDYGSITQMNNVAIGCLLAFMVHRHVLPKLMDWIKGHPGLVALLGVALLFVSHMASFSGKYCIWAVGSIEALSCFLIIAGLLHIQNKAIVFILNNKIASFLGAISYSLYLWQQPFSDPKLMGEISLYWRLAGMFAVAAVSYYVIEKPFLRMKDKFGLHSKPPAEKQK